jgi:hypothetical protein
MLFRLTIIALGIVAIAGLAHFSIGPIRHYKVCPTWGQC